MFVAPVDVGDGAYTAAGSVITEDVPPGALAVARGRQRNVDGWVERCRAGTASAAAAATARETESDDAGASQEQTSERHQEDGREDADALLRASPSRARGRGRQPPRVEPTPTTSYDFANEGDLRPLQRIGSRQRAFVIQSHSANINTWIMEQLIMVDALKRASAKAHHRRHARSMAMPARTRSTAGASPSRLVWSPTCSRLPG